MENEAEFYQGEDQNEEEKDMVDSHEFEDSYDEETSEYSSSPLIAAAKAGNFATVLSKLEQGVDKNEKTNLKRTALWHAARFGHLEIVRLLIAHGADKNLVDFKGETPLLAAAAKGHLSIVLLLTEEGADLGDLEKANRYGCSPLIDASYGGHLNVVRYLLEQGADRDKTNTSGMSSLYFAIQNGNLELVKLLMLYGAELNSRDRYGELPIDVAVRYRREQIAQAIRDEPRRRLDKAPGKRATEQDRHPDVVASASTQQEAQEDNEEGDGQSNKKPRIDNGEEVKVAEEDEDSEPSDWEEGK